MFVALKFPKGFEDTDAVLFDSLQGKKLCEGDPPAGFLINYDGLGQYSRSWREIRAYAVDSAGVEYRSKRLPKKHPVPSWVR